MPWFLVEKNLDLLGWINMCYSVTNCGHQFSGGTPMVLTESQHDVTIRNPHG